MGHAVDFRLARSGAFRIHWSANPRFFPLSLFGDLFQSPYGKFHLALATGLTCYSRCVSCTVSHGAVYCGTGVAPARCQLSRIPLCLGKAKSEQLRVEWVPTKPTPTPYQMHTATGSAIARKPGSSLKLAKCPWQPRRNAHLRREVPVKRNGFLSELAAPPSDATRLRNLRPCLVEEPATPSFLHYRP